MSYALHGKLVGILAAGLVFATLGLAASSKTPAKKAPTAKPPAPPVTNLYPSGTIEFSAPGAMGIVGGMRCDTNGNIYLRYAPPVPVLNRMVRNRQPMNFALTKLSVDSQQITKYRVGPIQGYTWVGGVRFYVTPRGGVYALAQACKKGSESAGLRDCASLVVKYHHDGSVDSVVKLHKPQGGRLAPVKFAVFLDGDVLVTGEQIGKDGGMQPFTGIFGRGGDFLTRLILPHDVGAAPPPPKYSAGKLPSSGPAAAARKAVVRLATTVGWRRMVGSPDGTIYLLQGGWPGRLYVVSSSGRVLREENIMPPRRGLSPLAASVNGQGLLFIFYTHYPTPQNPRTYWALALVNPETGKTISTYRVPRKAGIPACMTSEGVILFTQESKSGHLAVAEYTPE